MVTFQIAQIINNKKIGPYTLLRIEDSAMKNLASCGQFFMAGFTDSIDIFLPRPLSFLEINEDNFSVLIKKRGQGTQKLSHMKKGDKLKVLGPLGQRYNPPKRGILIAGGIGIAPLYFQSQFMKEGILLYGTRRKEEIVLTEKFKENGFLVKTITEEESGGTICDLVRENLLEIQDKEVFICGPESMIVELKKIINGIVKKSYVYLERRMGCGMGGCKSCAVKTVNGYRLLCKEGPIFPLEEVEFD